MNKTAVTCTSIAALLGNIAAQSVSHPPHLEEVAKEVLVVLCPFGPPRAA